jgi:hypothetical protein
VGHFPIAKRWLTRWYWNCHPILIYLGGVMRVDCGTVAGLGKLFPSPPSLLSHFLKNHVGLQNLKGILSLFCCIKFNFYYFDCYLFYFEFFFINFFFSFILWHLILYQIWSIFFLLLFFIFIFQFHPLLFFYVEFGFHSLYCYLFCFFILFYWFLFYFIRWYFVDWGFGVVIFSSLPFMELVSTS